MSIRSRDYCGKEDCQQMRKLLMEHYQLSITGYNWALGRLDWWRFRQKAGTAGWEAE